MKWAAYPVLVWAALLLQTTWGEPLSLRGCRVDWPVVLAVWYGLHEPRAVAVWAGWGVGLAVDMLSVGPMGLHAILFAVVNLAVSHPRRESGGRVSAGTGAGGSAILAGAAAGGVVAGLHVVAPLLLRAVGGADTGRGLWIAAGDGLMSGAVAAGLYRVAAIVTRRWAGR